MRHVPHLNGENKLLDIVNDGHLWVSTTCSYKILQNFGEPYCLCLSSGWLNWFKLMWKWCRGIICVSYAGTFEGVWPVGEEGNSAVDSQWQLTVALFQFVVILSELPALKMWNWQLSLKLWNVIRYVA